MSPTQSQSHSPAGPKAPTSTTATLSKELAINYVDLILKDAPCELTSFEKFKQGKKLRSSRYKSFYVLCHKNTRKHAGWLVCKYILTGGCPLKYALMVFNTSNGGTGRLDRHMSNHVQEKNQNQAVIARPLPQQSKTLLARTAAMAVSMDLRPISFTDKKIGMRHFVDSVFKAGQSTPVSDNIDPSSFLPCAKTVRSALTQLAQDQRDEYKSIILPKIMELGGAATIDGLTLKVQDKQFYDFTLHFLEVDDSKVFSQPTVRMSCKTILLREKSGGGTAGDIRGLLGGALAEVYDVNMEEMMRNFTVVTDCESVMARVAGSSVSKRIAPQDQRWLGCMAHQLNTAMKSCIASISGSEELHRISDDLQAVKTIVRLFKQSGWNGALPPGYHLIQEVETRFGITFSVVQRFLKSRCKVRDVVFEKDSSSAKLAYTSLLLHEHLSGESSSFPALEAIVDAFQPIVEAQTRIQASQTPTVHLGLPLLQRCKDLLERTADGASVWRGADVGFVPPHQLSRELCRAMIEWLNAKVRIHPFWLVGCFLHPFFREFQFIGCVEKRYEFKSEAESLIRALMSSYRTYDDTEQVGGDVAEDNATVTSNPLVGQKPSFSLMDYADSHFKHPNASDEITKYNNLDRSLLGLNKDDFVKDDFAAVTFWYSRKSTYPLLYKVALRVYAIPVSSCASERVFSAVNHIVTRDRANLLPGTLEDIIIVRSLLDIR